MSKTFKRKNKTNRDNTRNKRLLENKKQKKSKQHFKRFKEHLIESEFDDVERIHADSFIGDFLDLDEDEYDYN